MKVAKRMKRKQRQMGLYIGIAICSLVVIAALIILFNPHDYSLKLAIPRLVSVQTEGTVQTANTQGANKVANTQNTANKVNTNQLNNATKNQASEEQTENSQAEENKTINQVANNNTTTNQTVNKTTGNKTETNQATNKTTNNQTASNQTTNAASNKTNTNQTTTTKTNNTKSVVSQGIQNSSEDKAREIAVAEFAKLGENVTKDSLTVLNLERKDGLMYYYIKSSKNTCEVRKNDGVVTRINANPVN